MSVLSDRAAGLVAYLDDQLLTLLMQALLAPAEKLSLVAHGDGEQIGSWQAITDPQIAELPELPYAAQWACGVLPARRAGEIDDQYLARARDELLHPRGLRRGGAEGLQIIARSFLAGTQSVRVVEAPSGDLWSAVVIVNPSEVTDTDALTAALNDPEVVPAGFQITIDFDDSPLIDEGTLQLNTVADTVTIDNATLDDIT